MADIIIGIIIVFILFILFVLPAIINLKYLYLIKTNRVMKIVHRENDFYYRRLNKNDIKIDGFDIIISILPVISFCTMSIYRDNFKIIKNKTKQTKL